VHYLLDNPNDSVYIEYTMKNKQNIKGENKMRKITAKEYRENYNGKKAYVKNAFGTVEIKSINDDYWAYAPNANGGWGRSFSLHAKSEVLINH